MIDLEVRNLIITLALWHILNTNSRDIQHMIVIMDVLFTQSCWPALVNDRWERSVLA